MDRLPHALSCARRQLINHSSFTDRSAAEHSGQPGDYLVESSDGFAPHHATFIFLKISTYQYISGCVAAGPRLMSERSRRSGFAPAPQRFPASAWGASLEN